MVTGRCCETEIWSWVQSAINNRELWCLMSLICTLNIFCYAIYFHLWQYLMARCHSDVLQKQGDRSLLPDIFFSDAKLSFCLSVFGPQHLPCYCGQLVAAPHSFFQNPQFPHHQVIWNNQKKQLRIESRIAIEGKLLTIRAYNVCHKFVKRTIELP